MSKIVATICGPFDEAVEKKQEQFEFESGELLTQFAKYLIEYLDTHFGGA